MTSIYLMRHGPFFLMSSDNFFACLMTKSVVLVVLVRQGVFCLFGAVFL